MWIPSCPHLLKRLFFRHWIVLVLLNLHCCDGPHQHHRPLTPFPLLCQWFPFFSGHSIWVQPQIEVILTIVKDVLKATFKYSIVLLLLPTQYLFIKRSCQKTWTKKELPGLSCGPASFKSCLPLTQPRNLDFQTPLVENEIAVSLD